MNPNKQSCLVINGNSDNIRHNADESRGEVITNDDDWREIGQLFEIVCLATTIFSQFKVILH